MSGAVTKHETVSQVPSQVDLKSPAERQGGGEAEKQGSREAEERQLPATHPSASQPLRLSASLPPCLLVDEERHYRLGSSLPMKFFRACVFLMLVLCQVAPAIALMLPPPVTCGMECCIESGVECCLAKKHGNGVTESDVSVRAAIGSPCPSQCAMLPAGFRPGVIRRNPKTSTRTLSFEPLVVRREQAVLVRDPLVCGPSAPRSPPTP